MGLETIRVHNCYHNVAFYGAFILTGILFSTSENKYISDVLFCMNSNKNNMRGSDISKGHNYKIKDFTDNNIAVKLLILGFLPGSLISLVRKSPFGGAYYFNVNGNRIALRKKEAETIVVSK